MTLEDIDYGELPLQVLSKDGIVVVYDANGAEVVPYTEQAWKGDVLLNVPNMASALKSAYEEPEELLQTNAKWMEDQYEGEREMWTDNDNGPDWFEPEPLTSISGVDPVDGKPPLRVVVNDDAPWPEDTEEIPNHEVRIEDSTGKVVYRKPAAEYKQGPTEVSELIKAMRLAYEKPHVLLSER